MSTGSILSTISPITLQPILTRQSFQSSEINPLLDRSTAAFSTFRHTHSLAARQDICRKFLDLVLGQKDVLAKEITEQMGRPIRYTVKEVETMVKRGEYLLKMSSEALKDIPGEAEKGFKRWVSKEPVGVVLVVFAWNYPYLILINSLLPAILAGNVVIIKPSPQTPTIAEHATSLFTQAGLPPNVIQFIHSGDASVINTLISHPSIAQVSFTGSHAGGLAVQKAAVDANKIIPITLELGGNDPAYVRSDVDIQWAAEEIVDGAVFNSGQSCCAIERVYVHESIHNEFTKAVVDNVKGYVLGDPQDPATTIGPVISAAAAKRIRSDIDDAISKGAQDLTSQIFQTVIKEKTLPETFLPITVLDNCNHQSFIMTSETFGPVIPISSVPDDETAIKLMNDSNLGLTASIWSKDVQAAERLAGNVEAGTVFVNRADYPSPDLVWNGWKESGRGGTLGRSAFEGFIKPKSWHIKDYPK